MDYIELCRKAIDTAVKFGAKEAEAFVASRHSVSVEIERAEIKTCTDILDAGIGLRALIDGKVGFAYTNILTDEEVKKTARQATKASKASLKDRNWRKLPEKSSYSAVKDTYDKRLVEFTPDEAVTLCQRMMSSASQVDKRVLPAFGGTEVNVQEIACVNTNGVQAKSLGTSLGCGLGTMARSEKQVSPMCFEFKASRLHEPEPEWIGQEAARLAVESLNVGEAKEGKFPVLLDQFALQSILMFTFIQSIRGDMVSRGRSIFKNRIGESVAARNISLYDNGILPGGLNSGSTDMEGVPRQKTPLIEEGILRGFLYDNYWAGLEGAKSTGNANRGGGGLSLPPYGTVPAISPTNIQLIAGTASEEELISEVGNGYYVRSVQGAHQSNPETGEFSVALAPAWRIEKGEITHAVKGVMIAGNAYEMLKGVSLLGKDTRQVGMLIAPKAVVSELNVVTK